MTEEKYSKRKRRVLGYILRNAKTMDVGSMLESLAGIGWDVTLLYDDNGHWAFSDGGFGSLSPEPSDYEGTFHAGKGNWRRSPRAAILLHVRKEYK